MPTASVIPSVVAARAKTAESFDSRPAPENQVCSDGELVRTYLARRDEAAFGELVSRFGPLVQAVLTKPE